MSAMEVLRFLFQSTPPVWGATVVPIKLKEADVISIHAPRVGGDLDERLEI